MDKTPIAADFTLSSCAKNAPTAEVIFKGRETKLVTVVNSIIRHTNNWVFDIQEDQAVSSLLGTKVVDLRRYLYKLLKGEQRRSSTHGLY